MKRIIDNNCRVCGAREFSLWGEKAGQSLYKCKKCGLVFFYPYPTAEELNAYYNNEYHVVRKYDGDGDLGLKRKLMYAQDIKDLEASIPQKGRILDVGCAEGLFLSFLGEEWEKYGIDCSEYAVAKANEKSGVNAFVKEINEMPDNFYDVIHFRGVIEHMLAPMDTIRQACQKLRDGGYLVLSNTPNTSGVVPMLFRGRFRLVIPNEHLHYFERKTVRIMAQKSGLLLRKFVFPYLGSPYCSLLKDTAEIPLNFFSGKESPPFYGNIFTAYLQKDSNE